MSLTWIEVRSEEEVAEVRDRGRQIAHEMLAMPGFVSTANMGIGNRLITTTAWEDPEVPKANAGRWRAQRRHEPDFWLRLCLSIFHNSVGAPMLQRSLGLMHRLQPDGGLRT